jgi:hypothetical protein
MNKQPWPVRLLFSLGLIMATTSFLLKDYMHIPDFFRGLIAGTGIGLEIIGLVLMRLNKKAAQLIRLIIKPPPPPQKYCRQQIPNHPALHFFAQIAKRFLLMDSLRHAAQNFQLLALSFPLPARAVYLVCKNSKRHPQAA